MTGDPSTDLIVLRHTGEIIDPKDAEACLAKLREVEEYQARAADAKRALTAALVEHSRLVGERTVTLPGGGRYVREGGPRTEYDAAAATSALRAAGAPPEVVDRIVETTIVKKVNGREAAKAARSNPDYKEALDSAAKVVEKPYTVRAK